MSFKPTYSIGEAAKMVGSTVKTVRYYDEIGLLQPSSHTEGGHRLYTPQDMWRLELITTLRYLNFGIADIRRMLSGEIGIDQALDLQIEALQDQVSTLNAMLSILQQAKQAQTQKQDINTDHSVNSLTYVTHIVDSMTANAEKRKQWVSAKVEHSRILDNIPEAWKVSFLHFFDKYIMKDTRLSAKQTMAWNELQDMLDDPDYLADLMRCELPFFTMTSHPQFQAEAWVKKMEQIRVRAAEALRNQWPAESPAVQDIVQNFVMLYADHEQSAEPEAFFSTQARYMLDSSTSRIMRFNRLCAIVNPEWGQIVDSVMLLQEGMRIRLEQLGEASLS